MKSNDSQMMTKFSPFLLFFFISVQSIAQRDIILLNTGWKAKKAMEVVVDGTVISSKNFQLYDWMEAVVPGTVLTTLLHNKKVPDPFFIKLPVPDITPANMEFDVAPVVRVAAPIIRPLPAAPDSKLIVLSKSSRSRVPEAPTVVAEPAEKVLMAPA